MKIRKLSLLAATLFAFVLSAAGLSTLSAQDFGDDKEATKTHKVMEKVQVEHAKILNGVRNPAMFRKSKDDVVAAAKELAKLGKEVRDETDSAKAAKDVKDAQKKWAELMDVYVKEAESFAALAAKPDADQQKVKTAYKTVTKTCGDCHDVFRKEDEDF